MAIEERASARHGTSGRLARTVGLAAACAVVNARAAAPWEQRLAEAEAGAVAARELPMRTPVRVAVVGEAALAVALGEAPAEETPAPPLPLRDDDAVVRACLLGAGRRSRAISEEPKPAASTGSALASLAAGVYVPHAKALYVLGEHGEGAEASVLLHELVHALQDQHFGLARMLEEDRRGADALAARHAFAEGDATFAVLRDANLLEPIEASFLEAFLTGLVTATRRAYGPGTDDAEDATLPYVHGTRFVWSLYVRGGWRAVNAAWRRPPSTTEQLLHPEKYLVNEGPLPLAEPSAPPKGFTRRSRGAFGELDLRRWLARFLPGDEAARLASGWGQGAFELFGRNDERALRLRVRWDSPLADRASAVRRSLEHAFHGRCLDLGEWGALTVQTRGRVLEVLAGPRDLTRCASVDPPR